ncbi:protein LEG1 homolog isoform X2 [Microtus oregoni]|uniref:protein LEG1 homolog isoform X2 n=1 Tax=Microtus oregoni TaxID=111838 RepID=UPI001BB16E16|nr:protein LEG1 homolog isoform X2 [Microtus oregoni]
MWSALAIPTFLFLSLFSVGLASNPESVRAINKNYPPFWDQVSGDITVFPVKDNKIIINIWNYVDRLQMYKILITQTNKYFVHIGANDTGNVLWALALTYGKLYKTGLNFFEIVMNFLAAVESKFLNVPYEIVLVSRGENKSDFCYSVKECRASYPEAMDAAVEFYQYLQSTRPALGNVSVYNASEERATLLMWKAHRAAINIGLSKFTNMSWYSSVSERNFTVDFLNFMEFCESTVYHSDFNSSKSFLLGFPSKPLEDGENIASNTNFKTREKAFLTLVKFMANLNKVTDGCFFMVWKSTVESTQLRHSLGRFLIETLLLMPLKA